MADLGIGPVECRLHTDSSAAIGIAQRTGIGKIRHLAVHLLWIQEKVKTGDILLHKVLGSNNPADPLTKHLAQDVLHRHMPQLALVFQEGRSSAAPQALL